MKRKLFISLALVLSFFISTGMYSFNNLKDYYYNINSDDEEWDEVLIKILSGTGNPSMTESARTVSLFKPIKVHQSSFTLKVVINLNEKVNIKVTDSAGAPVYLRQFTPGVTNELLISTSSWSYGDYNITFTNSAGTVIATGEFSIH